jgi:secretion/DNA translocation related TadE-like protein
MRAQVQLTRGSISVALVAVLSVAIPFSAAAAAFATGVLLQQRVDSAADLAALAASDIRRGLTTGDPCETATKIVELAGATIESCRIVSDCVLVEVAITHIFWLIRSAALAGPP